MTNGAGAAVCEIKFVPLSSRGQEACLPADHVGHIPLDLSGATTVGAVHLAIG